MLAFLVSAAIAIPSGQYVPFYAKARAPVRIAAFALDDRPVTNAEFRAFVAAAPTWRRSLAAAVFAEKGYLAHWNADAEVPETIEKAPVTRVSWFAARAYCRARDARLPTTDEWEFALTKGASADGASAAALHWYEAPTPSPLPRIEDLPVDAQGIRGLQGLVWEWTSDFGDVFAGDGNAFVCGAGAAGAADARDYAAFMRFAYRGSLKADYAVANLGFRCAKDLPP